MLWFWPMRSKYMSPGGFWERLSCVIRERPLETSPSVSPPTFEHSQNVQTCNSHLATTRLSPGECRDPHPPV